MNDHEIDRLMVQAQSRADALVESLGLGRGGQELLEEIMSTPVTPNLNPPDPEPAAPSKVESFELQAVSPLPAQSRRRHTLIGVAAAVAFAAAIAGPTFAFRGGDNVTVAPGTRSAPAPAIANGNPLVLLDDPAWKITHVDEFTNSSGEIHFSNGARELEVHWYPADQYQSHRDDRRTVSKPAPQSVLGHDGELFTYSSTRFAVVLAPQGKSFLEIGGTGSDRSAFIAALAKLKPVTAEQWRAAMPDSVVAPAEVTAAINRTLADVPLPPGFQGPSLPKTSTYSVSSLEVAAIGQATCGWLKLYETAHEAGDKAGMARVDEALKTSRNWKALREGGGYSEVVWQYADLVSERKAISTGSVEDQGPTPSDSTIVEMTYRTALGCDDAGSSGQKGAS